MPKIKDGPIELNDLLEEIYNECMKKHNNEAICSASAWNGVKNAGWRRDAKTNTWKKKIMKFDIK